MEKEKGALDDFSEDFETHSESVDPFETTPKKEEEGGASGKEDEEESKQPEPRKNRHHRRLETKLQEEREANIALAERVKVLSETHKFKNEAGDLDPDISRIYGTDTPEAREATRILQNALQKTREAAEEAAFRRIEERQAETAKAQREAESFIDSELEELEDEFNVDLTSDSPAARKARREFLETVQKLSPKDKDGNIKDYADFGEAFEIYQSRKVKPDATRQKDLASRGMVKSGTAPTKNLDVQAQEQYLKDMGII